MKEKALQQAVLALAKLNGWMVYHTFDSRRSEAGFPDLVLVHPERRLMYCVELKSETGKLTPAQARWLEAVYHVGYPPLAAVWRPQDWANGLIESTLRFRRHVPRHIDPQGHEGAARGAPPGPPAPEDRAET